MTSVECAAEPSVRILVLDDEPDIGCMLRKCLFKQGYAVESSVDPSAALEVMKANHYDILVTDLKMPAMDGMSVIRKVKESSPGTEVIIMTGYSTVESAVGSMKLGAFDYVPKPFDLNQFLTIIRRAVEHLQSNKDILRYRELDAMKEDLLKNVSHEMRTPLSSIKVASDMLMNEFRKHDNRLEGKDPEKLISIIGRGMDRMINMVEDIFEVFRSGAGKVDLGLVPFSLERMILECAEEFLVPCQERGLSLKISVEAGIPSVMADPIKLRQAVLNLLGNAMKFTPAGGEVVIGARKTDMGSLHSDRYFAEIFVKDNGIGIPTDQQEKVFERFYQVQSNGTRFKPGLGIGLALVKFIAEAHGGGVALDSKPGEGSTFYMRIPMIPGNKDLEK